MSASEKLEQYRGIITDSYGDTAITPGELNYIDRHLARYVQTLRYLPPEKGKLLDVGCFPGHTSVLAAAQGWNVSGISRIDGVFVTDAFVERMKKLDIDVFDVDMERAVIPVEDNTFDCIFFNEIMEHLPYNPFHALDQLWRVLKPGGRLVLSVPNLASFDHVWALLRGRSIFPEISRTLEDAYHADIGQRHIREYTLGECEYLLTQQRKYLYRFDIDRKIMDRSWDGLFYTEHGEKRALSRIRPGTILRALSTRLCTRYRSNIIVLATKPHNYVRLPEEAIHVNGFHESEFSGTGPSFVRHPLKAAWMKDSAVIELDLPATMKTISGIQLLAWMPAPAAAGTLELKARINGTECAPVFVVPSSEPSVVSLRPSQYVRPTAVATISLESTKWSPRTLGLCDDRRSLGPMICLEQAAVSQICTVSHPEARWGVGSGRPPATVERDE